MMARQLLKTLTPINPSLDLQPGQSFLIYYTTSKNMARRRDLWIAIIIPESKMPAAYLAKRPDRAKPVLSGEWTVMVEEMVYGVYLPGRNTYQWAEKKNLYELEDTPPSIFDITLNVRFDAKLFHELHCLVKEKRNLEFWLAMAAEERSVKGGKGRTPFLVMPMGYDPIQIQNQAQRKETVRDIPEKRSSLKRPRPQSPAPVLQQEQGAQKKQRVSESNPAQGARVTDSTQRRISQSPLFFPYSSSSSSSESSSSSLEDPLVRTPSVQEDPGSERAGSVSALPEVQQEDKDESDRQKRNERYRSVGVQTEPEKNTNSDSNINTNITTTNTPKTPKTHIHGHSLLDLPLKTVLGRTFLKIPNDNNIPTEPESNDPEREKERGQDTSTFNEISSLFNPALAKIPPREFEAIYSFLLNGEYPPHLHPLDSDSTTVTNDNDNITGNLNENHPGQGIPKDNCQYQLDNTPPNNTQISPEEQRTDRITFLGRIYNHAKRLGLVSLQQLTVLKIRTECNSSSGSDFGGDTTFYLRPVLELARIPALLQDGMGINAEPGQGGRAGASILEHKQDILRDWVVEFLADNIDAYFSHCSLEFLDLMRENHVLQAAVFQRRAENLINRRYFVQKSGDGEAGKSLN